MAEEITLRAYIELIETMIRQGRMDEAIAHSAHVLQFYPKNAVVYRNLGRALMRLQRYEEASEIFRRLLAAMPDDFSAHYQLSIVYEQEKNGDAALWHIERAFDQQPNSAQVNDRLRDLYKKFKNVDVDKIQLTAGAVAIQYNKSGMYDEAISLLQRTLVKVPDRADLLTLLAMTQWKHGDVVDAAETALDVLKSYPYALEANRILSELWLQEERPSDAQRYLSRVEDIDPYLAYEIATDDDVLDSQFMVEELDFSKYAASLASQEQAPDWLSNIEELAEAEPLASTTETSLDELDSDAEDLDWLTELQEDSQPVVPVKKVTDDLSDLLPDDFNFPDSAGQDDTVDTGELSKLAKAENEDAFAELFGDFDDDEIEGTGLTGLLADDDDELPRPAGRTTGLTGMLGKLGLDDDDKPETDDLSWLDEVSAGRYDTDNQTQSDDALTDMDVADDFFAEMEEGGDDDDPLAWLETDNLISNEDDGDNAIHTAQLTEKANIDPNDPMAWLQDSGIEFDEDADDSSNFFVEDEPATIESDELSPMAWLGEDIETDEPAYDTNEFNADADDALQEDPMAWLSDEGLEIDEFDDDGEDNDDDFGTNALTIQDEDDSLSWLTESGIELDDEPENVETLDTNDILTGQLASLNETSQEVEGDPMAWLAEGGVEFLDDPEFSSENEDNNWLDDDSVLDDLLNIADLTNTESNTPNDLFIETEMQDTMNDQPDWTPDDDFSSDDELDWLVNDESGDEVSFETEADNDDSMAWLEDNGIEIDDEPEDDFAFEAQTDDDSMAWLEDSGIEIDDEPEDDFALEAQADDDSMAWLEDSGIEIDDEPEDDFAFEAEADEDSLAWLEDNGIGIDDELEDDLPQPTGKTSLLNFLSDEHEEIEIDANIDNLTEAEAFAEEDVDWLRALDGEEIEDEEEISEGETFADDFSETSDAEVEWNLEQTSDGDDFDWGKDEPIEDEEELDWMAEPNAEVEDFFPDFDNGDTDDEDIAEPADADWLSELDEEPIAEDSDFADFDDEDELDEFPEPAKLDWLDDSEQQPVAETTDADWGELGSGFTDELDEANAETQDEWAVGSGFTDELSEDEDEFPEPAELDWLDDSEQQPVAETADADWLSELGSGFTDELDEANAETQDEWAVDSGFTDELNDEEDEFPEPAEADWLSELDDEPLTEDSDLSDFDELDDEDEFPEPAEADWLSELDDEPLAEDGDLSDFDELDDEDEDEFPEPAEADWLNELDDEPLAEDGEEQPVAETADADWLSELEDDSDDSIEEWSEDEEFEAEAVAEAWDNEEEVTDELIEPQPALETDEDNWLSGIGVQEADEWGEEDYDEYEDEYELNISSTTGMSDMLETIRSSREEDDDSPLQDFEQDEPDWLKQTGELISPVEEEEAIPMAEFEEFDDDEEFEALADDSYSDDEFVQDEFEQDEFIQDEYQEELEQADADNAPDWLNAMVPGLDLDFEAEDEGHLDEGFETRENTLRERRVSESEIIKDDFDWLQDIVEEETGVMDAVSDEDMATTPPPTPLAPRKQYIFSSPPVWARDDSAKESIAQTVAMASEVPDYLSDFDEFEEVNEYDFDETLDDQFKFESEEIVTVDDEFDEFDNIEFTSVDDEFDEFGDDNAVIVDEPVQELQDEFDDTPLAVEDFDFNNDSTVKAKAIDDEFGEFEDALSAEDTGFDFDNAGTIIEDELDDALTVEDSDFDFDNTSAVIDDEFEDALSAEDTGFDFDNAGAIIEDELDDEFDEFDDFDDEFDEFDDFDDEFDD